MPWVFPDGAGTLGDSGAALIRTNGTTETVIGTRYGRFTFPNGRVVGVYSAVRNYN